MDSLYRNIQKLNGLCGKHRVYWKIKYDCINFRYEGILNKGIYAVPVVIEAEYLDDLVERLIGSIESNH